MTKDLQQAISHVLQQDSKVLEMLLAKFKQIKQLDSILSDHIDQKLASHCQVANFDGQCLIILTDSALWATQLRFQIPELLVKLQQHPQLYQLKHINCKIRPAKKPLVENLENRSLEPLSDEAAQAVLESANTIKHEKLRAIMRKIGSRTSSRVKGR